MCCNSGCSTSFLYLIICGVPCSHLQPLPDGAVRTLKSIGTLNRMVMQSGWNSSPKVGEVPFRAEGYEN